MTGRNRNLNQNAPGDRPAPEANVADGTLILSGTLVIENIDTLDSDATGASAIDISNVDHMDTAGAWYVVDMQQRLAGDGDVPITGASDAQNQLIDTVRRSMPPDGAARIARRSVADRVEALGRRTVAAGKVTVELISFLGQVIAAMGGILIRPRRLRLTSLVHHMQEVGWNAIPIVALMSFLIGVVLAFQGSVQLRQFGAEVFVVDLIAI